MFFLRGLAPHRGQPAASRRSLAECSWPCLLLPRAIGLSALTLPNSKAALVAWLWIWIRATEEYIEGARSQAYNVVDRIGMVG